MDTVKREVKMDTEQGEKMRGAFLPGREKQLQESPREASDSSWSVSQLVGGRCN